MDCCRGVLVQAAAGLLPAETGQARDGLSPTSSGGHEPESPHRDESALAAGQRDARAVDVSSNHDPDRDQIRRGAVAPIAAPV